MSLRRVRNSFHAARQFLCVGRSTYCSVEAGSSWRFFCFPGKDAAYVVLRTTLDGRILKFLLAISSIVYEYDRVSHAKLDVRNVEGIARD